MLSSQNIDFACDKYIRFDLDEMNDDECNAGKKLLVDHANYDLENKDLSNVLDHCRLKELDCAINYIWKCTLLSILSLYLDVFRF